MLSCRVIFISQVCEDMLKRAKTFALLAAFKQPGRLIPEEFTKEVPKPALVGEETSEDPSFVLRSW